MKELVGSCHCDTFTSVWSGLGLVSPHVDVRILTCGDYVFPVRGQGGRDLAVCVAKPCQEIQHKSAQTYLP